MLKTNLIFSILLPNIIGASLTPKAGKTQKMTKIFKKLEKIAKVSIILRVCSTKTYSP